jgi:hypothetical protein
MWVLKDGRKNDKKREAEKKIRGKKDGGEKKRRFPIFIGSSEKSQTPTIFICVDPDK